MPKNHKTFWNFRRAKVDPMEAYQQEEKFDEEEEKRASKIPGTYQGYKFDWSGLSTEDKVERASHRAYIKCELEDTEPFIAQQAFNFYGVYTRISELQKFRYAEGKVINHYKSLI